MTSPLRALAHGAVALAALVFAADACAQSSQAGLATEIGNSSVASGKSFIDLSVGKATYATSCGSVAGLTCSRGTTSYSLTAGNMFTENLGVELSAMNLGKADRAGGSVIARGINLSAVGRVPVGNIVGVEGKVGTTYGVTRVSAAQDTGLSTGRDSGFGLAYGAALDVNIERGLQASIGWEQHDFHFVGQGMSKVKDITLSVGYTF